MSRSAALSVGAANALARVTGMARDILFAAIFGAGATTDAFNAAFRVPQLLRELLAEGSLQNVVVPSLSATLEREGLEEAWRLANAFLGLLLVVLGVATLTFIGFAPFWVHVVAAGFAADPAKFELTTALTRWLSPFLFGLSLSALLAGMLNVRGKFFVPAMAQNVLNGLAIAGCLLAGPFERATGMPGIFAVALATTLSGFIQVGLSLPLLWRDGYRFRPTLGGHPRLRGMLATVGPALIGISTVQGNLLIESQYASTYGDGVITWLYQSFRLVQIPLAMVSGAIATALLTQVSAHHVRGERAELSRTLAWGFRSNAFLVLPSAVAMYVLAEPLVRMFYEHGAFTHEDTLGTASLMEMYGLACFGICLHRLIVPVYYALGRPQLPMWASIGALAAKIPVILVLTRAFGMGAPALPLSHAITVTAEVGVLGWGLRESLRGTGLVGAHLKMGVAAAVLGGLAWLLRDHLHVVLVCAIVGVAYLGVARALGVFELGGLLRRPKGLPPFIDPDSRAAMEALASGPVRVEGDRLVGAERAWRLVAKDDALALVDDGAGDATGDPVEVEAIIKLPPPRLGGLRIGTTEWHAEGERVVSGGCPGPRVLVGR